jgi:hypothetical protein
MNSWFIRHTERLGVLDEDVERLWAEDRIAIHFPGTGPTDSESLDQKDYTKRGERTAIRRFVQFAHEGGYVWSQYRTRQEAKVGFVEPETQIEIRNATWGHYHPGRIAKLKTLQLKRPRIIGVGEWMSLRVARPRQGTFSPWRKAYAKLESIVDGKTLQHAWENLSSAVQETVCSEFLRSHEIEGLPKLEWLLLPVGRTLKDVDIYGLATDGNKLFAQVTFLEKPATYEKKTKLARYHDGAAHLIMFCRCQTRAVEDNIHFVPVEADVLQWLASNQLYASLCYAGA